MSTSYETENVEKHKAGGRMGRSGEVGSSQDVTMIWRQIKLDGGGLMLGAGEGGGWLLAGG